MSLESIAAQLREEIEKLTRALNAIEGTKSARASKTSQGRPKRTMSASARRRISAAQKARWAKVKAKKKA